MERRHFGADSGLLALALPRQACYSTILFTHSLLIQVIDHEKSLADLQRI